MLVYGKLWSDFWRRLDFLDFYVKDIVTDLKEFSKMGLLWNKKSFILSFIFIKIVIILFFVVDVHEDTDRWCRLQICRGMRSTVSILVGSYIANLIVIRSFKFPSKFSYIFLVPILSSCSFLYLFCSILFSHFLPIIPFCSLPLSFSHPSFISVHFIFV